MAEIQLKNVCKRWGKVVGVDRFDLHIADQEFLVLLGPSGCGKSTTMRMIAGLEDISEGEIVIGGRVVNDLEPKDRDISMVFQSYGLYPNLSVYENIRFPLKVRKIPKAEHHDRVMKAAEMVDLLELLERRPAELSGGQRQRVALGRAIVREPTVFLMDEPLSNLDAKLRVSTRAEIKNLQHRLKTTTIYVTHDQVEAMTLADRVVVMNKGVVQQVATPTEIYDNPANTFVASFIGSPAMNLVEGVIADGVFQAENIHLAGLPRGFSGPVTLGFRAEDVTLVDDGGDIAAPIFALELLGESSMAAVRVGRDLVNLRAGKSFRAQIGSTIRATIPPQTCHLFDVQTGQNLTYRSAPEGVADAADVSKVPLG
ncbi:sn-glycerol-3-phosphate ABC transporter ATP-binding protein UgpC [Pseudooceanicola sediminis]|uniref:sn-glycerol-3-phosphate ABC transporter ATP-binding protein UgpC n=1 Tax=Pseudooceanicola sediminis TaxID=2211117 RepID=A0A399IWP3_9RHOB|nr:sn-glycerol-3-phosphate ABC transporter ATP-binding protein UgpC [Pseudooceanicola sediminis]KAA2314992.1 sn-glycerol-3-phosphate ABC transporter ATP-binding protein UgpC [Puniceibacterium sp. HSS470]RII37364.1 sn-glycerol-3-phosphate ABC transporter ATP-binding protein UgpC [Pseudooceanicola sediminis]|tara:strand:- start:47573 stop:48682 length:1110 start_codon:yes stop_codon:yes gene_type:complete